MVTIDGRELDLLAETMCILQLVESGYCITEDNYIKYAYRHVSAFRKEAYTQVVGHTPVETITEEDGIISTDVFSTYRDGRQIGESAMIVIDSQTDDYEKINVVQ